MLTGLNHLTIAVSELTPSLAFYTELLGMTAHVRWQTGAYLSLDQLWFCLSLDQPAPAQDYSHIAFAIAEENFGPFAAKLREAGVPEWKQNRSEGASIYFCDPDGHKLEAHSGTLQSRLAALQDAPYADLVWL